MIDKLSFTCNECPDELYLEHNYGIDVTENRKKFYRNSCTMDRAVVQWRPHRFSRERNDQFSYSRVVLNPKRFSGPTDLLIYVSKIYGHIDGGPFDAHALLVTRIDVAADSAGAD